MKNLDAGGNHSNRGANWRWRTREEGPGHTSAGPLDPERVRQDREVEHLCDMFREAGFTRPVIEDVYAGQAYDLDATCAALLAMQADHEAQGVQPEPAEEQEDLWQLLPVDCRLKIIELLTVKELARAASVSRDFAQLVRQKRAKVPVLLVSAGLARKPAMLTDVLRAHPSATGVSLTRAAEELQTGTDFGAWVIALTCSALHSLLTQPPTPCRCHIRGTGPSRCDAVYPAARQWGGCACPDPVARAARVQCADRRGCAEPL